MGEREGVFVFLPTDLLCGRGERKRLEFVSSLLCKKKNKKKTKRCERKKSIRKGERGRRVSPSQKKRGPVR